MTIKNYFNKPNNWAKRGAAAVVLASAVTLLGSCGGSGVSSDTGVSVGALSLVPGSGSLFANVPFTFTIAGGVKPYRVSTSEQTLIPNQTVSGNTFVVVPNNPGVVDPVTDPNIVPSRSIRFTIVDNAGTQVVTGDTSFKVVQNFITGYNLTISSGTTCGATVSGGGTATAAQACVGFVSTIDLRPTTAGVLFNNRPLRFSINYGQFLFIDKNSNPPDQAVPTITLTTSGTTVSGGSEGGSLRAFLAPTAGVSSQFAGLRITDVQSGLYRDVDFFITRPATGAITLTPSSLGPLTGGSTANCGTGQVNVRVTGGEPPYRAVVSAGIPGSVTVNPSVLSDNTGTFTIGAGPAPAPNCLTEPNAVIVTDSAGATASFGITTVAGTTPPLQALDVIPRSITCVPDNSPGVGTPPVGGITYTSTIAVIGGNNLKIVNSSNPSLLTVTPSSIAGTGTVTITSNGIAGATAVPVTVNVTDGASPITVTVSRKSTCP